MRNLMIGLGLMGMIGILLTACKHDPIMLDDDLMPVDTMGMNPIDTMVIDTTVIDTNGVDTTNLNPCDPDKIYFETEVLPLLKSNCAFSGCHNATSAANGIVLESYESTVTTAEVEPFNLNENKLFKVLISNDEEERMPPPPASKLSASQLQLITTWILQGAENLECDPNLEVCETSDVSFTQFVQPLIDTHCRGCHSGTVPSGGIDLSNHSNIQTVALSDQLTKVIRWESGVPAMPQGGEQLSDCNIDKIVAWVEDGALDN